MNKKTVLLSCISAVACVAIVMAIFHYYDRGKAASTEPAANQNEVVIPEVDLTKMESLMIGSEPPKLIYADNSKVIFETTGGVYVYDLKETALIRSFDTSSFASARYSNVLPSSFATQDGNQLIFNFNNGSGGFVAAFRYSLADKRIHELTEQEAGEYRKQRFECIYLKPSDERYQKSSGMIASTSGRDYVYLTFRDWKVSTINVVYVQDDQETVYRVFASNE
ncbi:hypothetical protein [Gorillibacterium sp. CAU 1737]|uniref:hypothetical protein n=1 Tax=Gorillibacterium sp. CAU 1737 TaxID=3140362 RepID=UPI003260F854